MKSFIAFGLIALFTIVPSATRAQTNSNDSTHLRMFYDEALTNGQAYGNLRELCKDIGSRLSGSPGAAKAVNWGEALLHSYHLDSVWRQPVTVPHWVRGHEWANTAGGHTLTICSLGGSVGSHGEKSAKVVRFNHIDSLRAANPARVKGKMVYIDQKMDASMIITFNAYGKAFGLRYYAAIEAAKKGAVAVMIRSLGLDVDDYPHTGTMTYNDSIKKIPAMAVSTRDAEWLTKKMKQGPVNVRYKLSCKTLPDEESYNVIGELRGTQNPDEVIVVGGHLDSWDLAEGAHDDGAGVVQSIEVLRMFKKLGIKPNHTIRCILFMNEENGNHGGETYARWAKKNHVTHLAAVESDAGGFTPRGFSMEGSDAQVAELQSWKPLFEPYMLHIFKNGHSGTDIGPLENGETALIGFRPDPQRYFDIHHNANDVFENVDNRELHMGAASMASLIYLIDRHGMSNDRAK